MRSAELITDPTTGECVEVELFVAVMSASNFTYAVVTATQQPADWIASHVRLVEYLGGVPRAFVPDQLKAGVLIASRFEPAIQRTYDEWSQHYATTIFLARPGKARDKAKVEGGGCSRSAGSTSNPTAGTATGTTSSGRA